MKEQDIEAPTDRIADLIVKSKKLVVFTGAGHSTESGIPDFRSPGGIWDRFDPDEFTYQKYVSSAESRRKHWDLLRQGFLAINAEPNPGHYAIAELDRLGKLDCVITQNVDSLHQEAGVPDRKVFELHGNMRRVVCLSCGRSCPFDEIRARLDAGEENPDCAVCGGIIKPDSVFFGESLPVAVLEEASNRSMACDLFIVIGSSLVVYPAAYMPIYADQVGARLVIINLSPTPMDNRATVLVRAKAGETLPAVVQKVKERMGGA